MASTVPAKSQSLHNFTLPHLKWNKDGHSGGHHQRRRSVKSPSRRPNASSASPVRHSPLRDSVSATPPRHQSPLSDFQAMPSPRDSPARRDYLGKQSSTHGEPPAPFPFREWVKRSATSVDPPPPPLHRHGLASESNTFAELKRLVEYQRLHSKNLKLDTARNGVSSSNPDPHKVEKKSNAFAEFKSNLVEYQRFRSKNLKLDTATNGVSSSNPDRGPHKLEKKSKAKEVDATGIKRSKKILIKIPCKSNKLDEESPQREPLKTDTKDEADETDEGREQGNINNNTDEETKIWNLRPRKSIRTLPSVNGGGGPVKNNGSAMPERHKGQSPLRNLSNNKPGGNGGRCGGGRGGDLKKGSDKKEKRKLSVSLSLSKDEIEEDIFSLTGSKPARRPKKRSKIIQRQLNSLFPGSWLVSISADSYKVSEKFS